MNFLDYAFKFHKAKIQTKDKDKFKIEEYVYDLENTYLINIDLYENMIYDHISFTSEQRKFIKSYIEKIKELFNKKKTLREDKIKLRGKLLMDKQIMEEFRRRNEENNAYYQEQVEEHKENLEKKDSFIKQFEKKFYEVEIYVQREAKNDKHKWDHFLNFEILGFINNNELLNRKKVEILDETKAVRDDIDEILKENVELKKRDESIDMSDVYDNQKTKYASLIKLYKSKIKFLERNKEHLNQVLNSLNCQMENNATSYQDESSLKVKPKCNTVNYALSSVKPLEEHYKILSKNGLGLAKNAGIEEEADEENELNKSQVNIFSQAKRDNSMLDHSLMKPEYQNNNPKFGENKEHLWDISCIENNDN